MLRPADRAWIAIGIGVVAYDLTATETLSEAVDRYLLKRPTVTRFAILAVAKHLANDLAPWADPIGIAFLTARRIQRFRQEAVLRHAAENGTYPLAKPL